ncbi:hypothetical protein KY325_02915 [Candidatus Woesearchaeota archaeon]|nr:hypothetical protein [Candidatus Woesearchaeota archaeon]MBW3018082.1 hypothetical protein [Candidatus Woesearchaeota archaeon]
MKQIKKKAQLEWFIKELGLLVLVIIIAFVIFTLGTKIYSSFNPTQGAEISLKSLADASEILVNNTYTQGYNISKCYINFALQNNEALIGFGAARDKSRKYNRPEPTVCPLAYSCLVICDQGGWLKRNTWGPGTDMCLGKTRLEHKIVENVKSYYFFRKGSWDDLNYFGDEGGVETWILERTGSPGNWAIRIQEGSTLGLKACENLKVLPRITIAQTATAAGGKVGAAAGAAGVK